MWVPQEWEINSYLYLRNLVILVTLSEMKPVLPLTSDGQRPLSLGAPLDLLFIAARHGRHHDVGCQNLKNTRLLWVSSSGLHN